MASGSDWAPNPPDQSTNVTAAPVLTWASGSPSHIENGGFETGLLDGWRTQGGQSGRWIRATDGFKTVTGDRPPPLGGTNMAATTRGAAGMPYVCHLWQEVGLPSGATGAVLSWGDLWRNQAPWFDDETTEFRVEVRSSSGAWRELLFSTGPGSRPRSDWTRRSADLTAWLGQDVRVTFAVHDVFAGMTALVDEVRVETWPREGTQFRVYLSTNAIPLASDLVGTIGRAIWSSAVLAPGTTYFWQVAMLVDGSETRSPVWQFTTAPAGSVARFAWRIPAGQAYAGYPFPVVLEAVDAAGRMVPDYSGRAVVGGQADRSEPPQVVISELIEDGTALSLVELANASAAPVDLSGWRLAFYDATLWPAPKAEFAFPSFPLVQPGAVVTVRSGGTAPGTAPRFRLGTPLNWGWTTTNSLAAALLRNPAGNVVDFVCAGGAWPEDIRLPVPVPAGEWVGAPLATPAARRGDSHQRLMGDDRNQPSDWVLGIPSANELNPGLPSPLFSGRSALSIEPGTVELANGSWTGLVTVPSAGPGVVLTAANTNGLAGCSPAFEVRASPPLHLALPAHVTEGGPDALSAQVRLLFPLSTNLTVTLTASQTDQIVLPPEVVVAAGSTETDFVVGALDNLLLDGTRAIVVSAAAPGFEPATGRLWVWDNESAALSLTLPAFVREGATDALGRVTVSRPPDRDVLVALAGVPGGELDLPSAVIIPRGATSVDFALRATDDNRIDGSQVVTVSADVANWSGAAGSVNVEDNETLDLAVTLPAIVVEGLGNQAGEGRVSISGLITTDLPVVLASTRPDQCGVPASVVIAKGQTSVAFPIATADDTEPEQPLSVEISATAAGFASGSATTTVEDDDPHHFAWDFIFPRQFSGQPFAAGIRAVTAEGATVVHFRGAVQLGVESLDPVSLTPTNTAAFAQGQWPGVLTLFGESAQVELTADDGAGHTGTSEGFELFEAQIRTIELPASDFVSDPHTGRLYAVGASAAGALAGRVVVVDPVTLATGASTAVEGGATRVEVSDDGQFLYVAADGGRRVVRLRLPGLEADLDFALGEPNLVEDMAIRPGHPRTVAIAMYQAGISPRETGVRIYDDAVARPLTGIGNRIEWGESSDLLYGLHVTATGFGATRQQLESNGIVALEWVPAADGFDNDFHSIGDRLYADFGQAFDLASQHSEPGFPFLGSRGATVVTADPSLARAFAVMPVSGRLWAMSYDLETLNPLNSLPVANEATTVARLARWGSDGLAFLRGQALTLVRGDLVPSAEATDIAVRLEDSPRAAPLGSNVTYTITVANAGPNLARRVVASLPMPPGASFVSVAAAVGAASLTNNGLTWLIGDLAAGGQASLQAVVRSAEAGLLIATATVHSGSVDLDTANDRATVFTGVDLPLASNQAAVFSLGLADFVQDPTGQRVYAAVRSRVFAGQQLNANPSFGSSIVVMDLRDGRVDPPRYVEGDPQRLAVSDDGQFLYAVVHGGRDIRRLRLPDLTPDFEIELGKKLEPPYGDYGAYAIGVVPGAPRTLLVSRWNGGVVAYDDAVMRPIATAWDDQITQLELAGSPATWHGYGAWGTERRFYRLRLDADGVRVERMWPWLFGGAAIAAAGDMVYSTAGEVFDAALGQMRQPLAGMAGNEQAVVVDPHAGRVLFAYGNMSANLSAYDRDTVQFLERLAVPWPVGNLPPWLWPLTGLRRWGDDGFALLANTLMVVGRTELVPCGEPVDLGLRLTDAPELNHLGETARYLFTVANQGAAGVPLPTLQVRWSAAFSNVTATASSGSVLVASNVVTWRMTELAAGSLATIEVCATPGAVGPFTGSAALRSTRIESTPIDNYLTLDLEVAATPGFVDVPAPGGLVSYPLKANDLVYNGATRCLYASVSAYATQWAGCVVRLDPSNCTMTASAPLGGDPWRLAVADDGSCLYVALDDTWQVVRLRLPELIEDQRFGFGMAGIYPVVPEDMLVPAGRPESVVVARKRGTGTDHAGHHGVALYENGVLRGAATPSSPSLSRLVVGTNDTQLFGFDTRQGGRIVRLTMTASGVSSSGTLGTTVFPPVSEFLFHTDRIVLNSGTVVDAGTGAELGVIPGVGGYPMALDAGTGRILFATGYGTTVTILPADDREFSTAATEPLAVNAGVPLKLVRWGPDGLALANQDRILLWRSRLAAPTAGTDFDRDGLPDDWEAVHGLDALAAADASADLDRDGAMNRDEYSAGTNPTEAGSVLRIESLDRVAGHPQAWVRTIAGKRYQLERTESLRPPAWVAVGPPTEATGEALTITDLTPLTETTAYYRVRLVP